MHKQYIFFAWFKTLYKWHHTIVKQLAFFAQFLLFLMKVSNILKNKKIVINPHVFTVQPHDQSCIYIHTLYPSPTHSSLSWHPNHSDTNPV